LLIGAIVLILQVPLLMLGRLTNERGALREEVLWQQASLRLPLSELAGLRQLSGACFAEEALSFSPPR
jgi:hypothetical protein